MWISMYCNKIRNHPKTTVQKLLTNAYKNNLLKIKKVYCIPKYRLNKMGTQFFHLVC